MKGNCAKRKTRGSEKPGKTTNKMVYEFDDDYIPSSPKRNMAVIPNTRTRSHAATIRKSPVRISDAAITPQKCTNTMGATSNPPMMTSARRIVETNNGVSAKRGKQPAEEFTDENVPHGNQDLYPSTDSSSRLRSQFERLVAGEDAKLQQPSNSTIPPSTELVQNILPSTVAKEKNGEQEAHSFHLTEMAAMMNHGPSNDNDEAESSIDQSSVPVGGYLVKKDIAPLLKQIMDKHDIAKECKIKNRKSHVPYLEMICVTCQKLENMSLKDIDDTELEGMLMFVEGMQHMGFDIRWLSERLKDVSKVKRLLKDYPIVKEANTRLDMQQKEIDVLKQRLSAAEAEFLAKKMEVDKVNDNINQEIKDMKLKGVECWEKSLLHGLI